jgi:hypothetical protein
MRSILQTLSRGTIQTVAYFKLHITFTILGVVAIIGGLYYYKHDQATRVEETAVVVRGDISQFVLVLDVWHITAVDNV